MAGALYNRYRPRTFGEVIGQGHVTDALRRALETGRMHHAYLFSGPRGCGKTSSARILAASLNCVNGPTPEPCGVCDNCVSIRNGSSVDVVELDAASNGGVDDTRELRDRAAFAPANSHFRIFIIDEAHMITAAGFNALLKLVEEPPPHVRFVFATTDPDKVLQTIRSRTFHYQFGLVPPGVLKEHLRKVCTEEGVTVEDSVLPLVVRVGEGSVRDSLSVLDQLIAGAGEEGVTYAIAAARLGLTDSVLLDEAVDALADHDGATLFGVVERVVASGQDPRRFGQDLLERLRDLILLAAVPDARDRGMLETVGEDQLTRMRAQAVRLGAAELSRAGDVVHSALVDMRGTTSPRLVLELLIARLLLPAAAADEAGVLVRLERIERRLDASPGGAAPSISDPPAGMSRVEAARARLAEEAGPPAAAPVPAPVVAPASPRSDAPATPTPVVAPASPRGDAAATEAPPVDTPPPPAPVVHHQAESAVDVGAPAAAPAGGPDLEGIRNVWDDVLAIIKDMSVVAHVLLSQHGSVAAVDGNRVTLAFSNQGQGRNFESRSDVAAEALSRVLGGTWVVVVEGGSPPPPPPPPTPAAPPPPAPAAAVASRIPERPPLPPEPDEPSDDDVELPSTQGQHGEDAALAMLQQQLGGTVIGGLDL